jgi:hypothetical protein
LRVLHHFSGHYVEHAVGGHDDRIGMGGAGGKEQGH